MKFLVMFGATASLALCGCRETPTAEGQAAGESAALKEAREHFTYQGKPIPPFFLHDFAGGPGAPDFHKVELGHRVVSVSVSGLFTELDRDTSAYDMMPLRRIGVFHSFHYSERATDRTTSDRFAGYRFVGTAPCGVTVLEYTFSGGGSGVFNGLLLTRLQTERIGVESNQERLVLRLIADISWGDRVTRSVTLEGDQLMLGETTCTLPRAGVPEPPRTIQLR